MVKALEAVAVTVIEPPKLTEEPLIVMALLVRLALPMFDSVFDEPLIDTPLKVEIDPPKLTGSAPMVIELLTKDPLPMLVRVLLKPLIVLLVRVWEPVRVATTVVSMEIVPVEVIGPPSKPVPVLIRVTPPDREN